MHETVLCITALRSEEFIKGKSRREVPDRGTALALSAGRSDYTWPLGKLASDIWMEKCEGHGYLCRKVSCNRGLSTTKPRSNGEVAFTFQFLGNAISRRFLIKLLCRPDGRLLIRIPFWSNGGVAFTFQFLAAFLPFLVVFGSF